MKKIVLILMLIFAALSIFAADNILPPQNLLVPTLGVSDASVTLIWEKPKVYSNVSSYDIFQNDKLISNTTLLNFTINGLPAESKNVFTVKAKGKDNSSSVESNKVEVTTLKTLKIIDITKIGAKGDGKTLNTKAIQKAIDECTADSKVVIPEGKFLSGALFLKSNVTLEINGTLLGSDNIEDYPFTSKRFPYYSTNNYMGLLNAYTEKYGEITNVKIYGKGTIDGGTISKPEGALTVLGEKQIKAKSDPARGDLLTIKGVTNLYLGGLKFVNPAEHTIFVSYCKNITIDGIKVLTYDIKNGDGIDLATSDNIKLFNSLFDTGDDCINLNAGYGIDGYKEAMPCSNLRIFNNTTKRGHGGVALGSYTAGWIKNLLVEDCLFDGTERGIRLKTAKPIGGGADNLVFRDIIMKNIVNEAIIIDSTYSMTDAVAAPEAAVFKNVLIENITVELSKGNGIKIYGLKDVFHFNIVLRNITLSNTQGAAITNLKDSKFENVKFINSGEKPWKIYEISNVTFDNCDPKVELKK